jgi:hypothetical protein
LETQFSNPLKIIKEKNVLNVSYFLKNLSKEKFIQGQDKKIIFLQVFVKIKYC